MTATDYRGYHGCLFGSASTDRARACANEPKYKFTSTGPSGERLSVLALACEEHQDVLEPWDEPNIAGLLKESL